MNKILAYNEKPNGNGKWKIMQTSTSHHYVLETTKLKTTVFYTMMIT